MAKLEKRPLINRPYPLPPLPPNMEYMELLDPDSVGENALTFEETSDPFDKYIYRVSRVLYSGKTPFQDVLIADTYNWGLILVLDGAIQSSEDDEALYHAFEDPRVRLIYDDGRKFVENDSARYDVVIIDVVDMLDNGPAQSIYTRQFYEHLRRRLNPDAVVVVQGCEFSFLDDKPHAAMSRTLRTVFPEVHSYRVDIPSFLSSWGFIIASDWFRPDRWSVDEIERTIQRKLGGDWLDHITGEYLKNVFSLCKETQFSLAY